MNTSEQQRFDCLYQQHLTNLTLQGKRPATIDAYSQAVSQSVSQSGAYQPMLIA